MMPSNHGVAGGAAEGATVEDEIGLYIRSHSFFVQQSDEANIHTAPVRRAFERDVYDFARSLKLSKREAMRQGLRARQFCGEVEYRSDESALGNEVSESKAAASQPPKISSESQPAEPLVNYTNLESNDRHQTNPPQAADSRKRRKRKRDHRDSERGAATPPREQLNLDRNTERGGVSDQHLIDDSRLETRSPMSSSKEIRSAEADDVDSRDVGKGNASNIRSSYERRLQPEDQTSVLSEAHSVELKKSGNLPAHLKSHLSDADRGTTKSRKRQRRSGARAENLLAQVPTKEQERVRKSSSPQDTVATAVVDTEVPRVTDATEPKSEAEAHENFVRANEREPNENGRSVKKSRRGRKKSREKQVALDTELRAFNAYANEQQVDSYNKGQLAVMSKAVKDDIEDAKAVQERLREDDNAGMRESEGSIQAAAKPKRRRKRKSSDPELEHAGKKHRSDRKNHKSRERSHSLGFPTPMIQ